VRSASHALLLQLTDHKLLIAMFAVHVGVTVHKS
jgi:hypothetical protein